jgi:excisionase family DNA binding protein
MSATIETNAAKPGAEPRTGAACPVNLIDIETLAAWLGTSIRHVRRLVVDKRVPYVKVGHFIRFHPDEIVAWIDHQKVPAERRCGRR